ncbi:MAG: hypothetical protein CMP84_00240 [Gammaproteobacteria bacterium]|nr:hypothetical protein [Gammaproteobacteria bacterium]
MKLFNRMILAIATAVALPLVFAADNSLDDHPGFVDFSSLTAVVNVEPTVEISLKAPLLRMVTNLIRAKDDQAAGLFSELMQVTVNVYESNAIDVDEIANSMSAIAENLDGQGWDRVVRVRKADDHSDIYMRMSDDAEIIYGITIMVAEPGDTVMVNIVGEISGDDISALGRLFDIDEFDELEVANQ